MQNGDSLGHNPNATAAELLQAREGFNVNEHLRNAASAPRFNPGMPQSEFRRTPPVTSLNLEELRSNLRQIGMDIVMIGDKPSDPGGFSQNQQERITTLEAANASLLSRAVTAEATAADAIRELKELKASQETEKPRTPRHKEKPDV